VFRGGVGLFSICIQHASNLFTRNFPCYHVSLTTGPFTGQPNSARLIAAFTPVRPTLWGGTVGTFLALAPAGCQHELNDVVSQLRNAKYVNGTSRWNAASFQNLVTANYVGQQGYDERAISILECVWVRRASRIAIDTRVRASPTHNTASRITMALRSRSRAVHVASRTL